MINSILKISIIGGGNVAYHLALKINSCSELELVQIYNRSPLSPHFDTIDTEKINHLEDLKSADIYIICVKDEVIKQISEQLPFKEKLVIHTSGNTSIEELSDKNRKGVLYMVQSFSKDKPVDFEQIPICIEAEKTEDEFLLKILSNQLSPKTYLMNSMQRKYLHISAVFLNNFTNHLWFLSKNISEKHQIPFEILTPLFNETYQKAINHNFYDAQTGPARRDDKITINKHLELIDDPIEKDIYKLITYSILKTYGREKL